MTIDQSIAFARSHKDNPEAYARVMSAGIRQSLSIKTANKFREAIKQDHMEYMFIGLMGDCPIARPS